MPTATVHERPDTSIRPGHGCRSPELSAIPDITMGELVAFVTLLRCGSFTAAARELHLSQPGFSGRIARLERAIGGPLTDRSTRRLALTPIGKRFLPVAESVVRLVSAASVHAQKPGRAGVARGRDSGGRAATATPHSRRTAREAVGHLR